MPYFLDENDQVVVTLTGESPPKGARPLSRDIGDRLRLRHKQSFSPERAALLAVGDIDGYLGTFADAERPVLALNEAEKQELDRVLLSTTPFLYGWEITSTLGVVVGNTVRTRNVLSRIGADLKAFAGGELGAFVKALSDSRDEALRRMVAEARRLGANAVVGVSFSMTELLESATEVLASGTAVRAVVAPADSTVVAEG